MHLLRPCGRPRLDTEVIEATVVGALGSHRLGAEAVGNCILRDVVGTTPHAKGVLFAVQAKRKYLEILQEKQNLEADRAELQQKYAQKAQQARKLQDMFQMVDHILLPPTDACPMPDIPI